MSALQRWCTFAILAIAFIARVWALDFKPAHFDEGVNGSFIDGMRQGGAYHYDPANYHGPLHFYVLFAGQQLFGRSLWVLRMPTVIAGVALVAMMLAFRRFLPFRAAAWAALFAAVSPALIFYSRYAIHEMWLPLFAIMAVYGGCGLAAGQRRVSDLWWVGMGLTGMVLTKETYLLHFVAALLALGALWIFYPDVRQSTGKKRPRPADLFSGGGPADETKPSPPPISGRDVAAVWLTSIGLIVAFYSGFGFHWDGARGILDTFAHMQTKGTHGEEGHNKETLFWVKLLAYYEWPALLGFLGAPFLGLPRSRIFGILFALGGVAMLGWEFITEASVPSAALWADHLRPDLGLRLTGSVGVLAIFAGAGSFFASPAPDPRIRWMALYGLASFAAYALIPYKTAWCSINFLWPFCFIAAFALERLTIGGFRILAVFAGIALTATSVCPAYRLNFVNPTNDSLPPTREDKPDGDRYAYVQTTFDINHLLGPIRALIRKDATQRQMTGIVLGESFPLVWELNELPNVHFDEPEGKRPSYDADFLLIPESRQEEIEAALVGIYFREPYLPRGGGEPSLLYLQADRFRSVLPEREPEFKPRVPVQL